MRQAQCAACHQVRGLPSA
ncbi:MAG: hypothetical protein ACO1OX_02415 [Novosphingobium sp.]